MSAFSNPSDYPHEVTAPGPLGVGLRRYRYRVAKSASGTRVEAVFFSLLAAGAPHERRWREVRRPETLVMLGRIHSKNWGDRP